MANPPLETRLSPSGPLTSPKYLAASEISSSDLANVGSVAPKPAFVEVADNVVTIKGEADFVASAAGAKSFALEIPIGREFSTLIQRFSLVTVTGASTAIGTAATVAGVNDETVKVTIDAGTLGGATSGNFTAHFELVISLNP